MAKDRSRDTRRVTRSGGDMHGPMDQLSHFVSEHSVKDVRRGPRGSVIGKIEVAKTGKDGELRDGRQVTNFGKTVSSAKEALGY